MYYSNEYYRPYRCVDGFYPLFCVQHNGMIKNSFIKLLTVIHNRFSSCSMLLCATPATSTSLYYTALFPLLLPTPNSNLAAWSAPHTHASLTLVYKIYHGFCQFLVILSLDPITLNCTLLQPPSISYKFSKIFTLIPRILINIGLC